MPFMEGRIVAHVSYRGRGYYVDQSQMWVRVIIPNNNGVFGTGGYTLRTIDWHGPTARAVRLRANHAAENERIKQ